ncbi:MAG: S8 family serine peptidase [Planctomycetes bacterium]|nr:S8 family serine peptidase [Planctomycetota bacterium]
MGFYQSYKRWLIGFVVLVLVVSTGGNTLADDQTDSSRLRVQSDHASSNAAGSKLMLDDVTVLRTSGSQIHSPKLFEFSASRAVVAVWRETGAGNVEQEFFTVAPAGATFIEPRLLNYDIKLRDGDFEPLRSVPSVHAMLKADATCRLHIVQFATPPLIEMRKEVERFGEVRGFLPQHSYVVEMDPASVPDVAAMPFVRWVGPYHPDYRLDDQVLERLVGSGKTIPTARYRIMVFDSKIGQQFEVADWIGARGGDVHVVDDVSFLLEATLSIEQLAALVTLDQVAFVEPWSAPRTRMDIARSNTISGADFVESVGGYTGVGVRAEVMDNGIDQSHTAFTSRLMVRNGPAPADSALPHGSSTFGIVFGDGTGNALGRGMMPDAEGIFSFFNFAGSRTQNMLELSQPPFLCVFQSNSWGFADTPNYTAVTAEMDQIVFAQDILVLHSMGNAGAQTGVEHAWGKNIVGVGGVRHFNNGNTASHVWGGSGSIGPASDGRIKPDLTHFYDSIRTTTFGGGYTGGFGGTSGACPIVAGHFGLFFEMWADGLFGNPVSGGTVYEERPHAATAKAMLINTANSYAFSGAGADLTRTHQGWGLPSVSNLYDRKDNFTIIDETALVVPFGTAQFSRTISSALPFNDELRVTMVYTDRAGSPAAGVHRVNDLSLKVTSPSNVVYWGNQGLLTGNLSVPGGSSNTLDTVENVFIDLPEDGIWKVEVLGDEIVLDGHLGTGALDADFALVIYGGQACPIPVFSLQPINTQACMGDDVTLSTIAADFEGLQWSKDGSPLLGETDPDLVLTNVDGSDYGVYQLRATNTCGFRETVSASVDPFEDLAITQQPAPALTSCIGNAAVFSVATTGDLLGFTWQKDFVALVDGGGIVGSNTSMLTINNITTNSVGTYRCEVTGACGAVELSSSTVLTVTGPTYTSQPSDVCASVGGQASFTAVAVSPGGASQFTQWFKDGVGLADGGNVLGTFGNTLTISPVGAGDVGVYAMRALTLGANCILFSDDAALNIDGCCATPGDMDNDGDFDLFDVDQFNLCFAEDVSVNSACLCANVADTDVVIDLLDWEQLVLLLTGPQ